MGESLAYMKAYELHGYPVFASEMAAVLCRGLLGLPLEDLAPHVTEYLLERRRANGSFNNVPAADGGDGHVVNTWRGLRASRVSRCRSSSSMASGSFRPLLSRLPPEATFWTPKRRW